MGQHSRRALYQISPDCSIPVVHTLREGIDWVRFPAVRFLVLVV